MWGKRERKEKEKKEKYKLRKKESVVEGIQRTKKSKTEEEK